MWSMWSNEPPPDEEPDYEAEYEQRLEEQEHEDYEQGAIECDERAPWPGDDEGAATARGGSTTGSPTAGVSQSSNANPETRAYAASNLASPVYCTRCNRRHAKSGKAEESCLLGMRFADQDHRRRGGEG